MKGDVPLSRIATLLDLAVIITDPDGVIHWVNDAFTRLYGYRREEVIGTSLEALLHVPSAQVPPPVARLMSISAHSTALRETIRSYRADSTPFWADLHLAPVLEGDVVVQYIALIRDVTPQVQAEEALREVEERTRLVVELAPDAIIIHQQGIVIYANPAAARLFNVTGPGGLAGHALLEFVHPESHASISARMRDLMSAEGPLPPITQRLKRLDGQVIDIEATSARISYAGRQAVLSSVRDVTRRTAVETALGEQQHLLAQIMAATPDQIYLYDLLRRCVVFVGGQVEAALGYTSDEIIALGERVLPQGIHPDDLSAVHAHLDQLAAAPDGTVIADEFRVRTAAEEWRWVRTRASSFARTPAGELELALVVARDVTERRQLEQELRVAEARFRHAATLGVDSIYEVDLRTGQAAILGGTQYEARGLDVEGLNVASWEALLHPEDRERVLAARARLLTEGVPLREEYRMVLPNGVVIYLDDRAILRDSANQPPTHMLGVTRDITARKQQEARQRLLDQQLQQAQRLESLGVLAGGIAHQYNNLLTAILGYAELLLRNAPAGSELQSGLNTIIGSGRRAADLTSLMLAYAGHGQLVVQPINLNGLIQRITAQLHALMPPHAALHVQLHTPLPAVAGNPSQLEQMVSQLVMNAAEASTGQAGAITIATGEAMLDRAALDGLPFGAGLTPGRYVVLRVSDTGEGMDRATLARIFEPFFTTRFTGRGLGLAAVHGIVRGHYGLIEVESTPGEGTVATVWLPAAGHAESGERSAEVRPGGGQRKAVLVIDDDEAVRAVMGRMLERLGFAMVTAASGGAGLELLLAGIDGLAGVFIDVTVLQRSGDAIARVVAERWPQVPFVVMSGYTADKGALPFTGLPQAGMLQKPFTLRDVQVFLAEAGV